MSRYRFLGLTVLVLALSVVAARTGRSAEPAHGELTYVIYSLADLGDDPDLGKWVADTIPEVIEPGSWSRQGDQTYHQAVPAWNTPGREEPTPREQAPMQALRYYAPKKILVVYHTAAVQAKVDAFLKDLKKSVSAEPGRNAVAAHNPDQPRGMTPAEYREPAPIRPAAASEPSLSYPVPAPARPPKHLFHFIIRYEGDGVVDENVVKAVQAQMGAKEDKPADRPTPASVPVPVTWNEPPPRPRDAVQPMPMRNADDKDEEAAPLHTLPAEPVKKGPSD